KMRLVNEDDAEFILSLRANAERTKYMLSLDSDLEKQRNWIKEYKKRQIEGKDYYFIFEIGTRKMGVLRISNIDYLNKKAKAANWIKIPSDRSITEKMFILWFFVIFDIL